ncbi:hypothetical protein BKA80DRAFT_278990 [Phyllosticta citrichinensis]
MRHEGRLTQWSNRRKRRRAGPGQRQCPERPTARHRRSSLARPRRDEPERSGVSTERHSQRRRRADWQAAGRRVARRRGRGVGRRGRLPMPSWQPKTFDVKRLVRRVEGRVWAVEERGSSRVFECGRCGGRLAFNCSLCLSAAGRGPPATSRDQRALCSPHT